MSKYIVFKYLRREKKARACIMHQMGSFLSKVRHAYFHFVFLRPGLFLRTARELLLRL